MEHGNFRLYSQIQVDKILFENSRTVNFRNEFDFQCFFSKRICKIPIIIFTVLNGLLWVMALISAIVMTLDPATIIVLVQNTVICLAAIPVCSVISTWLALLSYGGSEDKYQFVSDRIINTDAKGTNEIFYSDIIMTYETPKAFYIKVGRRRYCAVIKENFTKGDSESFGKFIRDISKDKYRKVR